MDRVARSATSIRVRSFPLLVPPCATPSRLRVRDLHEVLRDERPSEGGGERVRRSSPRRRSAGTMKSRANSSRTSTTWARTAPIASARSRARPAPALAEVERDRHHLGAYARPATESRPRCRAAGVREHDSILSPFDHLPQFRFDPAAAASLHGRPAGSCRRRRSCPPLRELRAIDPLGQPLRLAPVGPHDHQRIDSLEAPHERATARRNCSPTAGLPGRCQAGRRPRRRRA